MTLPTIHRNGTGRAELLEGYCEARAAIAEAIRKLQNAGPNGRDYYLQPVTASNPRGALACATDEHQARIEKLLQVERELTELADHVADAPGPRR